MAHPVLPRVSTTNLCLRGDTLLITESDSGCVLTADLPPPGQDRLDLQS